MEENQVEEMVTITKEKYDSLYRDSVKLNCLENGGVDNWEWYSYALQEYYKMFEDEV